MSALAKLDWATWVTILLAAIGVLIAALGVLFTIASVILGALAVFGFRDLKSSVIAQAETAARDAAKAAIETVVAAYPSPAQIREDIFDRVVEQGGPAYVGKFDLQAAAGGDELEMFDAPPTADAEAQVADTYPSDLTLPQSDAPPAREENPTDEE